MMWLLIPLAILSGVFGRMGGAEGYNTKWRDWGCSLIVILALLIISGIHLQFWWVYASIFLLSWGAFTTYWDWLFGKDTLWFSGLVVGIAAAPALFIDLGLWPIVLIRAVVLCVVWEVLNRTVSKLPKGDIIEELSRYAVSM